MRLANVSLIVLIAAFSVIFASCTKKGDTGVAGATGPAGPAGPSYTGAIVGHVTLYDQYGSKVLKGLQNVTLLVSGSSVVVDSEGYYRKVGATTGTYNISASCNSYGSTLINRFQFLSDTLNRDVRLSAIPGFAPTAVTVTPTAIGDSLTITFPASDTRARNCIVFINKGGAAGPTPDKYLLAYTKAITANSSRPVALVIPTADLTNVGFTAGQTVNVACYGYVVNDGSAYEDLSTGKTVYTAISASSANTTFTAP